MRLFGFELSLKRASKGDPAFMDLWSAPNNSAGVSVTPDSAMRTAAVYACVRVISETIATLPLQMFERLADGSKVRADKHPMYRMLHRAPNGWQTSAEFRDQMTMHAALRGAAYSRIHTDGRGARRLEVLHPDYVKPRVIDDAIVYELYTSRGREYLLQDEVLRVPYLVREGVDAVSPIRLHGETVAQAIVAKTYTNNFLRNGGRPPGYVKMDVPFRDPEQRSKFKERLQAAIGGSEAGSTLLLEQGEYKPIGISNADAQLLDITKASRSDVASIYRVPPHMIGDLERATWGNVEQQGIDFAVHCIGPWLTRWEQALSRALLTETEQDRYFWEFNLNGLMRGDVQTRFAAYAQARQWGWMSINDIRRLENLNAIEHGDDYLSPSNMVPTDMVGKTQPSGNTSNG